MTSSVTQDFLREIVNGERIPDSKLAYFGSRLCGLLHQALLVAFTNAEKSKQLTKRKLAERIAKKPEQLTRWLSYPGNLTLETVGEILIGMGLEIEGLMLVDRTTGARLQFPLQEAAAVPADQEVRTPVRQTDEPAKILVMPLKPGKQTSLISGVIAATQDDKPQYAETKVPMYGS